MAPKRSPARRPNHCVDSNCLAHGGSLARPLINTESMNDSTRFRTASPALGREGSRGPERAGGLNHLDDLLTFAMRGLVHIPPTPAVLTRLSLARENKHTYPPANSLTANVFIKMPGQCYLPLKSSKSHVNFVGFSLLSSL